MSNDKHDATYHGKEPNPRYDGINNPDPDEPYDWEKDPEWLNHGRPPGWFWALVFLIIVVFVVAFAVAR